MALAPTPSQAQNDVVDQAISEMMEEWGTPGAVVAVVREGEVLHQAAYGLASLETRKPVVFDETVFRLASLSKPVTAIAVMKLHELGRVGLDDPIEPLLGELGIELEPTTSLWHLLTHTAGFEDRFLLRSTRSVDELGRLDEYLAESLPIQRYLPGEVSLYSNHGMALAGLVAARVSGLPFDEMMDELIWSPLGLESASFDPRSAGDRLAQGYRRGEPVPVMGIRTVPASMLVASGRDMLRIMEDLLTPGESGVLRPDTVELMLSRQFSHHPELTGRALGWSEDSSGSTRRLLHSGATDGFSSALVLLPEQRGGIFVATNANTWVWGAVREILDQLFEGAAPSAPREGAVTSSVDPEPEVEPPKPGRYVPAQIPVSSLDKLRLLFEQARISTVDDEVRFRGRQYAPAALTGNDGWRSRDGAILIPGAGARGESFLFEEGETWVRLPWHSAWPLHVSVLTLLLAIWIWLIVPGRCGLLRSCDDAVLRRLLRGSAWSNLVFLLGMGAFFSITMADNGGSLRTHVPWTLVLLLSLPGLSLGLVAASSAILFRLFRDESSRPVKVSRQLMVVFGSVAVFVAWLGYWNLLGLQL